MKRILILLLIMQGCSTSKTSTKQAEQTKTEIKEVITSIDTSKKQTIDITDSEEIIIRDFEILKDSNNSFISILKKETTKRKKKNIAKITENKAISGTKKAETIQSTKTEVKSVDKRKISILESPKFWLYFAGFLLLLYFILKFAKKIRLL